MSKRTDWTKWLAVGASLVLGYIVFYALAQRPASDLSIHATWAAEGNFADLRSFLHHGAHPLWHILVAAILLTGLSLPASAALITALFKALEVYLLITLTARLLKKNGWLASVCVVVAASVTSVWIPWVNPTVYLGVGSPNTWHSPTQMAAMVMMLLCVPLTAACVETFQKRVPEEGAKANILWKDAILLSALLLLSLVAKPTFMQAFLPAACLYFLVLWIRKPKNSPFFIRMILVAAPAVLFMILQYLYYFGIIVPSQGNMAFQVSWNKVGEVGVDVLLTRAFPIFVLLTCMERDTWRKPLYTLTLLMDAVSILEMLFLSETGRRASDGNFGWAMMGSALMLWVITLPLFVKKVKAWFSRRKAAAEGQPYLEDKPRAEALKWGAGGVLLLWHVASGIYYIVYLLTTTNPL